ncbi:MAG: ABC transporter substrate-binding protein [Syntrophales bacterium]|nr:ABC transporter substrate-binding protein [Syntrophales bacterium]
MSAKKAVFLLIILVVSILTSASCSKTSEDEKNIVIPAILPLTGPSADLGQAVANGMQIAIEELKKENPSYKFELSLQDSKGQPKEAVTIFNALSTQTKSPIMLSWMSSVANALSPLAAQNKRVLIMGAAMPNLTQGKDFIVRVFPNAIDLADQTASYAAKKFKTCSILYVNDDYGKTTKDVFKETFEKGGGTIKLIEPLNLGETDFRTILLKLKKNPTDAVYIPAYGPIYVHMFQQIKEILPKMPVIADIPMLNRYTLDQLGATANGVVAPGTIVDDDKTMSTPEATEFLKQYKEKFNKRADYSSGIGHDMVRIAALAVMKAKKDGAAVQTFIKTQKEFKGVTGKITIDGSGDSKMQIELLEIKDGSPIRIMNK